MSRFPRAALAPLLLAAGCAHSPPPARDTGASAASHPHGRHHPAQHHESQQHHGAQPGEMPHRFEDAEAWAARFDDPARDAWQKPDEVVAALALPPDARVADIGSGTGYFAVRLARAVPQGRVYGADVEPDMARYLGERARREGLPHVSPVLAAPDDPKLPEPVDLILVVDTYHHVSERVDYFRRLREKLAPGGRLAIIDYKPGQPRGPPEAHKLSAEQVREELQAAGWRQVGQHDFLPAQYFLLFQPG